MITKIEYNLQSPPLPLPPSPPQLWRMKKVIRVHHKVDDTRFIFRIPIGISPLIGIPFDVSPFFLSLKDRRQRKRHSIHKWNIEAIVDSNYKININKYQLTIIAGVRFESPGGFSLSQLNKWCFNIIERK